MRPTLAAKSKQTIYMKVNPISYFALTSTHGVNMTMEYERTYIINKLNLSILLRPV